MWKKIVTFFKWAATYESNNSNKEKKEDDAAIIRRAQDKKETVQEKWRENTVWEEPKRARTVKGRYKADDKSTPDVNEAWEDGTAPKKQVHRSKYKKNL